MLQDNFQWTIQDVNRVQFSVCKHSGPCSQNLIIIHEVVNDFL